MPLSVGAVYSTGRENFQVRCQKIMRHFLVLILSSIAASDEIWEKDASNDVYIEGSRDGFEAVKVHCKENSMSVSINLEETFEGIFYTRGNYRDGEPPCFFDAEKGVNKVSLDIPYNGCNTKETDEGVFVNTVILQHDHMLIFPGDNAFEIGCSRKTEEAAMTAKIGLADPDPSAKEMPKHRKSTVEGEEQVTFTPDDVRPRKKKKKKAKTSKQNKNKDEL